MSDWNLYSDEITEKEKELGFELMEVANPHGEYAFAPPKVHAVVYHLGPSDRIIKLNNPLSGTEYQHQRFGTYGSSTRADWKPAQVPMPDPVLAIRCAKDGRDEGDAMNPHITPHDPGDQY